MMKPAMPMSMIPSRGEILTYIWRRKNGRSISRETHQGRNLIREVRQGLDSPSDFFALKGSLGALSKVNNDLISEVVQLSFLERL
jgi:hypothetical protein